MLIRFGGSEFPRERVVDDDVAVEHEKAVLDDLARLPDGVGCPERLLLGDVLDRRSLVIVSDRFCDVIGAVADDDYEPVDDVRTLVQRSLEERRGPDRQQRFRAALGEGPHPRAFPGGDDDCVHTPASGETQINRHTRIGSEAAFGCRVARGVRSFILNLSALRRYL